MEDIPKFWLISVDPNIVTIWRIMKYPEKRGKKYWILEDLGAGWKRSVPQWAARFCFGYPDSQKSCQAKKKKKGSQHKLSTTHPHPLTSLHWNFHPAWEDRVSTQNYRYGLTEVQGWIQKSHFLVLIAPVITRMLLCTSNLKILREWQGGKRKSKKKLVKPGGNVFFHKLRLSYPGTKKLVNRWIKSWCLALWTPKQSANWLHFSLSIDWFNIIQTWPASIQAYIVTMNKVTQV